MELKGKYQEGPFYATVNKNPEVTWSKVIDLFAEKGFSIRTIDKQSGLIVSDPYSFKGSYTFETKNGQPIYPNKYLVVETRNNGLGLTILPDVIEANWNIRVKDSGNNTSQIIVNLTNIKCQYYVAPTRYSSGSWVDLIAKSTGVLEKEMVEYINN